MGERGPGTARSSAQGTAAYLLCSGGLILIYALTATLLWIGRDFTSDGPLSVHAPRVSAAFDPGAALQTVERRCVAAGAWVMGADDTVKVVAARVDSRPYYGCYQIYQGEVFDAVVIDEDGFAAPDRIAKQYGAWPWIGLVTTSGHLFLGGVTLVVLLTIYLLYYHPARPGPPVPARWWQSPLGSLLLGVTLVLPFTLPFRRKESPARRVRLLYEFGLGWASVILGALLLAGLTDRTSAGVFGLLFAGLLLGWLGGRGWLAPDGFGAPDRDDRPPRRDQARSPDGESGPE
jgi:hypothetical protein